ncbi:MAG TPA: hypothetical protein VF624_14580 [Tepidisphaeraceae bacterium]
MDSLPFWALLPLCGLAAVLTVVQASRSKNAAAAFVLMAIGLRSILSSCHQYTYSISPLGLSYNALASVLVAVSGLLVIRRNHGMRYIVWPAVPLIVVMLVSTLVNSTPAPAASAMIKLVYFIVLATLVAQSLKAVGPSRFFGLLLPVALLPLAYQIVSIFLGAAKRGESDGSASYIGGFNHEAAYSLLIVGALAVVCFADFLRLRSKLLLVAWCTGALFLANYRTSILAIAPLLSVTLFSAIPGAFVNHHRALIRVQLVVGLAVCVGVIAITQGDRFSDIGLAYDYGSELLQPPGEHSMEYRRLLSGRPGIWSNYYFGWLDGTPTQKLVGFGPETWTQYFDLYAHNTLVSALFEIGLLGVLITCLFFALNAAVSLTRGGLARDWRLFAGHISFFVLNMATMPMWMIEGLIFYSIICGFSVYRLRMTLALKSG